MEKTLKFIATNDGIYCDVYPIYSTYFYDQIIEMVENPNDVISSIYIKTVFSVSTSDITSINKDEDKQTFQFKIADKKGKYYHLIKSIFNIKNDFFLSEDIEISEKIFLIQYYAGRRRVENIINKIDRQIKSSFYIGGEHENAISKNEFESLLKIFPTSTEKNYYVESRIDELINEFVDLKEDYTSKFQKYIKNKKLPQTFQLPEEINKYEVSKYTFLLDELKSALSDETNQIKFYSEKEWQEKVFSLILYLYPKYMYVVKELAIETDEGKRFLDFLVVDFDGNIDIIEIKKTNNINILNKNKYRNNYISSHDLTGAIMQAEKYLYHLNRNYEKIEKEIKKKIIQTYETCQVVPHIRNPKALIFLGRSNTFNEEQKRDYEIIKRKYSNIMDIVSFDDLTNRFEALINSFEKQIIWLDKRFVIDIKNNLLW